jgi:hypothetical protein
VPEEKEVDVDKTAPSSFVVLRSRDVVAFLDILPMVGGEFLWWCEGGWVEERKNEWMNEWKMERIEGEDELEICEEFMNEKRLIVASFLGVGHLLVTTRQHKVKVADMEAIESREIGTSFFPQIYPFPISPQHTSHQI